METTIRPIRDSDRAAWEPLWQAYLTFYETALPDAVTDLTWSRFFDPAEPVLALVAERSGTLVGFAHYLFHRDTWLAEPICYLEDLYSAEQARGTGVGRALIEAVSAAATAAGSSRLYWLTHRTNNAAMHLYDRLADATGFVQYQRTLAP